MRPAIGVAAALLAVLAVGAGCGEDERAGDSTSPATALSIALHPEGRDKPGRTTWDLRCDPAKGSLPDPAAACAALLAAGDPFAPPPPDMACTEIFGGYQILEVTGTLRGEPVDAEFSRADGCQIAAFDRVVAALGLTGAVSTG